MPENEKNGENLSGMPPGVGHDSTAQNNKAKTIIVATTKDQMTLVMSLQWHMGTYQWAASHKIVHLNSSAG